MSRLTAITQTKGAELQTVQRRWTHPSVKALAGNRDPVAEIVSRARKVITDAAETGLTGPPFEPFLLADYLKIAVVPREDIRDARTVAVAGRPVIEFNPNRPRGRVRYSICHELAHTLFPDCLDRVRNRLGHEHMSKDDWQLEMLCNIGAAELLMPIGTFPQLKEESLSIDHLMEVRTRFDVSSEALFLRVVNLTDAPCCVFSASRREDAPGASYQVDYSVSSKAWNQRFPTGLALPRQSVVKDCTAIGFTAKGEEQWIPALGPLVVECVGIPPYPNEAYPRVLGLVRPRKAAEGAPNTVSYLRGNAMEPGGEGSRLVAHVVNDKAATWGGGFALSVRKKWPAVQDEFKEWVNEDPSRLALGHTHLTAITQDLSIVHMICQHGYGPSPRPRIRYRSLASCLDELAEVALNRGASIHMPRIGCGQAGGSWGIVSELIDSKLCQRGLKLTIYDLPDTELRQDTQPLLTLFEKGTDDLSLR